MGYKPSVGSSFFQFSCMGNVGRFCCIFHLSTKLKMALTLGWQVVTNTEALCFLLISIGPILQARTEGDASESVSVESVQSESVSTCKCNLSVNFGCKYLLLATSDCISSMWASWRRVTAVWFLSGVTLVFSKHNMSYWNIAGTKMLLNLKKKKSYLLHTFIWRCLLPYAECMPVRGRKK